MRLDRIDDLGEEKGIPERERRRDPFLLADDREVTLSAMKNKWQLGDQRI